MGLATKLLATRYHGALANMTSYLSTISLPHGRWSKPTGFVSIPGHCGVQDEDYWQGTLDLGIAFQPARVLAEIPLAILPPALRIAPAGRTALVCLNLETYLGAGRQNQHLAGRVAARVANEGPFAGCADGCPKDAIADRVGVLRAGPLPLITPQSRNVLLGS